MTPTTNVRMRKGLLPWEASEMIARKQTDSKQGRPLALSSTVNAELASLAAIQAEGSNEVFRWIPRRAMDDNEGQMAS